MLNDLNELLSIPSVKTAGAGKAPFGKEIRRALDWFLNKAESMGLRTGEYDGYCGYAEYGEGEECIGVLCHLDVVPAGEGWTNPPYQLTIDGGYLYGRGVVDDKGPTIACLHALKQIKEDSIALKKRVRIIVGCDEEDGSACIRHYVKVGEIPAVSFVPDADFPIINSEKGILHTKVILQKDDFFHNVSVAGGHTINVVPDRAVATIHPDTALYQQFAHRDLLKDPSFTAALIEEGCRLEDFSVAVTEEGLRIEATGVAGHAMAPQNAENAVWKLMSLLSALGQTSGLLTLIRRMFCNRDSARNLGIACADADSGDLTISLDIVREQSDALHLSLDIRYPISTTKEQIEANILSNMPAGTKLELLKHDAHLFVPRDSALVQKLLDVYERCTGEKGYCLKCGGGTYARRLPNAIAFGPTFPDAVTNIHNIDECISITQFEQLLTIYKEAMIALAELKN